MPLVETVVADGAKICDLARDQHGTVTAFARSIGKRPEAIWNMRQRRCCVVSVRNITAIAEALGVPVGEITLADDSAEEAEAEPGEAA